jgi:Protein of unknown function (DUF3572)
MQSPTGAAFFMKSLTPREAEAIALRALGFLAEDRDRLERFLALSGLSLSELRRAAAEPGFLAGVLDHFAADEGLLLDFAARSELEPIRIAQAQLTLAAAPPAQDAW